MDDDPIILSSVQKLLSTFGFLVDACCDGEQAVALYEQALSVNDPYKVVILDLTIQGGMGGKEAIALLTELDSSVRAIVSSGYFNDDAMLHYREYGFQGVAEKPYRIEKLREIILSVMNIPR